MVPDSETDRDKRRNVGKKTMEQQLAQKQRDKAIDEDQKFVGPVGFRSPNDSRKVLHPLHLGSL